MLSEIQDGEVFVAPVPAPSFAPVFGKIQGTETAIGRLMRHATIVFRHYGLPAVTGTGNGNSWIEAGQLRRVNGITGQVTTLS